MLLSTTVHKNAKCDLKHLNTAAEYTGNHKNKPGYRFWFNCQLRIELIIHFDPTHYIKALLLGVV
jgi:hypothetical protein